MSFQSLGLIEPIQKALDQEGYSQPTPIQAKSIPLILQQKDLLGCAQTGTGKTAAFAIPILQLLYDAQRKPTRAGCMRTLILTPTRELAIQIKESFEAYGRFTGLRFNVIFGGVPDKPQIASTRSGVDVLIATPGRLLDLIGQGYIHFDQLELFVLDEADRMLDMGFIHDVKRIIAKLPEKRQSLFFSATMPPNIVELASTILKNPSKVEVAPVSSTADTIQQYVYYVGKSNKKNLLLEMLKDQEISSVLIFTRTKSGANRVVKELDKAGVAAEAIHGNKSQNARQRALSDFKAKKLRILVATDIAARGIDVDDLSHVINYEIPNISETYVHRIGRTGRAGASGIAFSFVDSEERAYLRDIQKLIGKTIPVVSNHPFPLTDEDIRAEAEAPKQQQGGGRGRQQQSQGGGSRGSNTNRGNKQESPMKRGHHTSVSSSERAVGINDSKTERSKEERNAIVRNNPPSFRDDRSQGGRDDRNSGQRNNVPSFREDRPPNNRDERSRDGNNSQRSGDRNFGNRNQPTSRDERSRDGNNSQRSGDRNFGNRNQSTSRDERSRDGNNSQRSGDRNFGNRNQPTGRDERRDGADSANRNRSKSAEPAKKPFQANTPNPRSKYKLLDASDFSF
jgi:ATP-dependent RNA helicase RhlE